MVLTAAAAGADGGAKHCLPARSELVQGLSYAYVWKKLCGLAAVAIGAHAAGTRAHTRRGAD